ncbi:MAG TPA: nitroreductase family protein [Planctomycetota bacterium]|jgi:nitroreductase
MNFEELIVRNRSYRRFQQNQRIEHKTLVELVDIARRTPCGGNRQPLRYAIVQQPEKCAQLFAHLRWAALLRGWGGPKEGERPAAYILILNDTTVSTHSDTEVGIAAQSMSLAATERGLGGCMIGSIDRAKVVQEFAIPDQYQLALVLALGVPAETCVLEAAEIGGSVAYYRDATGVHHVPKLPLSEVLINLKS